MSDLLTISETARELKLTRSEIFELAERGELSAVTIGGSDKILFSRDQLATTYKPVPASTFRAARERLTSRMALARSCRAIETGLQPGTPKAAAL